MDICLRSDGVSAGLVRASGPPGANLALVAIPLGRRLPFSVYPARTTAFNHTPFQSGSSQIPFSTDWRLIHHQNLSVGVLERTLDHFAPLLTR